MFAYPMVKKLFILIAWFPISILLLVVNLYVLNSYSVSQRFATPKNTIISPLADVTSYTIGAFSENTSKVLGASVIAADAREKLLADFLDRYNSPMLPYAHKIVAEADKNNIDFRLIVSIAMCESNLGKRIPKGSNNAWGIAVYTGQQNGAVFSDWNYAIEWVSKYIKERYINKGFDTLKEIGAVYAPPSVNTGNSWSNCVEEFQGSIF